MTVMITVFHAAINAQSGHFPGASRTIFPANRDTRPVTQTAPSGYTNDERFCKPILSRRRSPGVTQKLLEEYDGWQTDIYLR